MSDPPTPTDDPDAGPMSAEAGTGGVVSGAGAAGSPRAGAGGAGAAGMGGAIGAAGAMPAPGECTKNEDCKVAGSTCVDRTCFAPEPQCATDEECKAKGPEYDGGRCADRQCLPGPRWRCEPPAPASPEKTVPIRVRVIDALALSNLADIPLTACNKLDYDCLRPITTARSNREGWVELMVPENFSGYLQQNESRSFAPGLYFVPPRLPEGGELKNFPLIASTLIGGLVAYLGTTLNAERGHIMVIAEDCMGNALPGITYSSPQADTGTTVFYTRDQVPNPTVKATSSEGTGGFVNLPKGSVEITLKQLEPELLLQTVTVIIRPGYMSAVYIRPMPRGSMMTGVFPTAPGSM